MFVYNKENLPKTAKLLFYIKSFSWDHFPNIHCPTCDQLFTLQSPGKGALSGPVRINRSWEWVRGYVRWSGVGGEGGL